MTKATMHKQLRPGLYAITDNSLTPSDTLVRSVEAALKGGAVLVQYRDKQGSAAERFHEASDLVALCREFEVPLLINDDPELAKRVGAAGVHLGQGDQPMSVARERLGQNAIIGITCHDQITLAQQAQNDGADYLAFGRFYSSSTATSCASCRKKAAFPSPNWASAWGCPPRPAPSACAGWNAMG